MDRKKVIEVLKCELNERLDALNQEIVQLRDSLSADTKSSSGDKHETSRAMNQLEQERIGKLIDHTEQMLQHVHRIPGVLAHSKIQFGSIVQLNTGWFMLAIPIGKVAFDKISLFVLSMDAPLGMALLGKTIGDEITFNGKQLMITDVV